MKSHLLRLGLACIAIMLFPAASRAITDTTPPVLTSFGFAPGAVDVSNTSVEIAITASATDDISGVESISATFRSPSGKNYFSIYLESYELVAGDPLDGTYTSTTQELTNCDEPGVYTLEEIDVTDNCGNESSYAATAGSGVLAFPTGTPTTVTVTNTNQVFSTPTISNINFNQNTVNLTDTNSAGITVSVELTDTTAGVSSGYVEFVSPSGVGSHSASFSSSNRISGDQYDGMYQATVNWGSCDQPGNWTLNTAEVTDPCDNYTEYGSGTTAFPKGTPTTVTVTNPTADTTPPMLDSVTLSSTVADVTSGQATISGSAVATDNSSGVAEGYGYYENSSGKESVSLDIEGYSPISGTQLDGTFSAYVYADSCATSGTYTLKSLTLYDECGNAALYGGTNAAFPAGTPTQILVTNGTLPTGSIDVSILPETAQYDGSWNVDGGDTEYGDETVTGLPPGEHTVNFLSADGYNTPPSQNFEVAANQTVFTSGTYTPTTGDSVQVNVTPQAAANTAQWTIDNGQLEPAGATVTGIADGTHAINFSNVSGYTAPASQVITTASNLTTVTTGTYAVITGSGSLTVTITPSGATHAGATWGVDAITGESSGATVSGLTAGQHSVTFSNVTGYTAPAGQTVTINPNENTAITGTYTAIVVNTGSLTVNIIPTAAVNAGATWSVNGGASEPSGKTVTLDTGNYNVDFNMAKGYVAPASQPVTISTNTTTVTTGTYAPTPIFTGSATTLVGLSPNGDFLLTVNLGLNGKYTGKYLTPGGHTFNLAGVFDGSGYTTGTSDHVPYILQISGTTPSTYVLSGSANGKELTAYPAAYTSKQIPAESGTYTALLTNTDTSLGVPQGTGYATIKIGKGGSGSVTGKLADGTAFSSSSILVAGTGGNELFVYDAKIYGKKGGISGWFTFGTPQAGQFTGTLIWQKLPATKGAYYKGGIDTTLNASGALYVFNPAQQVPFTTGTATIGSGGLSQSIMQGFTVSDSGAVTITGNNPDSVKLAFKGSKGTFSGSFKTPVLDKTVKFSGMILEVPSNPQAGGYFLSPAVSGTGLSGNVTMP